MSIQKLWERFFIDLEFSRHYPHCRPVTNSLPVRNPILEEVLPSLLHVKATAILDAALEQMLKDQGLRLPRKCPRTLAGRLQFLTDQGIISDPEALHDVRKRRNGIAHEFDKRIDWATLGNDVDEIQNFFEKETLAGPRSELEFFAESSGARSSDDPAVIAAVDHRFGLRQAGRVVAEVCWAENLMRSCEEDGG